MELAIDSAVYANVQPVLLGYARRAVRHEQLAADLVQETWAAGAKHLSTFDGRSSLRSWLVGILRHKIIDHFRRSRREVLGASALEPTVEPTHDQSLDAQRSLEVVAVALQQLPELQRLAVELCDVRDLSREEAAAELGIERGHLRVLLHRARNRLREALEEANLL